MSLPTVEQQNSEMVKAKFESPLQKFIAVNCQRCDCWKANRNKRTFEEIHDNPPVAKCSLDSQEGIDSIFLCMIAANNQPVSVEQIMSDGEALLKSLGVHLEEEQTPDEQSAAGTSKGKYRQ